MFSKLGDWITKWSVQIQTMKIKRDDILAMACTQVHLQWRHAYKFARYSSYWTGVKKILQIFTNVKLNCAKCKARLFTGCALLSQIASCMVERVEQNVLSPNQKRKILMITALHFLPGRYNAALLLFKRQRNGRNINKLLSTKRHAWPFQRRSHTGTINYDNHLHAY